MKRQWLVGATAALVLVAVALGTRFARPPGPAASSSAAVTSQVPGSLRATAGEAIRGRAAQPGGSDDALCANDQRSAAGSVDADAADDLPREAADALAREAAVINRLRVSQSAENQASVALMAFRDPPERLAAINKAMSLGPRDATVVWAAVQICHSSAGLTCPVQEWEDELLKLDGQNSEAWIRVAVRQYERGDTAKALDALRHAATAAETNEYWAETVEMVERALDSAGGYSFPERVVQAIGFAAANLPPYGPRVNMCRTQSKIDAEWAHACLEYGRLVERQGKTNIGWSVALGIQKVTLEAMGNTEEAQRVEAQKDEATRKQISEATQEQFDTTAIIVSSPRLFAAYLAALKERGERAAIAEAHAEAKRLTDRCSQQRRN